MLFAVALRVHPRSVDTELGEFAHDVGCAVLGQRDVGGLVADVIRVAAEPHFDFRIGLQDRRDGGELGLRFRLQSGFAGVEQQTVEIEPCVLVGRFAGILDEICLLYTSDAADE